MDFDKELADYLLSHMAERGHVTIMDGYAHDEEVAEEVATLNQLMDMRLVKSRSVQGLSDYTVYTLARTPWLTRY